MPHPHSHRSLLFPVAQYIAFSLAVSLSISRKRIHAACLFSSHKPPHTPAPLLVLLSLSLSVSLTLSLCFYLTSALSTCLFRSFSPDPVPTSSACSPSCRNTPTCHVVVWVHVHEVSHSGTRHDRPPRQRSADAEYLQSWGYRRQCRVHTTAFRTHALRSRAIDRPPVSSRRSVRSIPSRNPFSGVDLASRDGSKRLLSCCRHYVSKTRNLKTTAIALVFAREMKAKSRENPIVEKDRGKKGMRTTALYEIRNVSCERHVSLIFCGMPWFFITFFRNDQLPSRRWYRKQGRWTCARRMTKGISWVDN